MSDDEQMPIKESAVDDTKEGDSEMAEELDYEPSTGKNDKVCFTSSIIKEKLLA